jgi:hypothetical protein
LGFFICQRQWSAHICVNHRVDFQPNASCASLIVLGSAALLELLLYCLRN